MPHLTNLKMRLADRKVVPFDSIIGPIFPLIYASRQEKDRE